MAHTTRAAEEGSVLEYALRRIRLNMEESALACRWVEDGGSWHKVAPFNVGVKGRKKVDMWAGGSWKQVELRDAAEVVNPVAMRLVAAWEAAGIRLEWVQNTLIRWRRDAGVDGGERAELVSVDVVLSKAVPGQGGRRDRWWVEMKWTRGDQEDRRLRVVKEGQKKVEVLQRVIKELRHWRLLLGGHPVYHPHRLGLLVVSPRGWRLDLEGGGIAVMRGSFDNGGGEAVANAAGADGGGEGEQFAGGGEEHVADVADVAMAETEHGGGEGDEADAEDEGGDDGGSVEDGGGQEEEKRRRWKGRRTIRATAEAKTQGRRDSTKRYKSEDKGYGNVLEYRLRRVGGAGGGGEVGSGGGDVGGMRRRTRSGGAAEVEGVTKIGRKRAKKCCCLRIVALPSFRPPVRPSDRPLARPSARPPFKVCVV